MARGTLRYWAAARAAAGCAEEPYDGDTLAEVLVAAAARHGEALAQVLRRCSYLLDEQPVGSRAHADVRLPEGGCVEVLPPFAGGSPSSPGPPGLARVSW